MDLLLLRFVDFTVVRKPAGIVCFMHPLSLLEGGILSKETNENVLDVQLVVCIGDRPIRWTWSKHVLDAHRLNMLSKDCIGEK